MYVLVCMHKYNQIVRSTIVRLYHFVKEEAFYDAISRQHIYEKIMVEQEEQVLVR